MHIAGPRRLRPQGQEGCDHNLTEMKAASIEQLLLDDSVNSVSKTIHIVVNITIAAPMKIHG